MATDNTKRIAEITAVLQAGVKQHTVDGVLTVYDFDALRAERTLLAQEDGARRARRPVASTIKLGGV